MRRILVVDDEPDCGSFVGRFLEKSGYAVDIANSGHEGLKTLIETTPDAMVLDIRMPKMNGLELLEILRSYLRWDALPVIILTAHGTPEQLKQARDMGVEHIFHKAHFTLPELGKALERELGKGN